MSSVKLHRMGSDKILHSDTPCLVISGRKGDFFDFLWIDAALFCSPQSRQELLFRNSEAVVQDS